MTGEGIQVVFEDSIVHVTFRGKGELNLLDRELIVELDEALEKLEVGSGQRVVILKGYGEKAFSAGVDVGKMKEFSPAEAEGFILCLHSVMRRIMRLPQPVIAAIVGPCLGGALELAMACDIRVAAENALFGLPEIRVGIPSVIEASLLHLMIGLGRARELILTGDTIDAKEAWRLGLVSRPVRLEQLDQETMKMARRFLRLSPLILSTQKDILDKWLNLGEEEGARYSAKAFALCFATNHPREGMEAFLQKRHPKY
ncbi:MAG: enoyl-CoA hydratase/isomerase family protein [Desulfobacteraceae bacterium]|nr:enoyl-CoA hydratase/isomerase family protein [Desulfobacteraceae bacterium]